MKKIYFRISNLIISVLGIVFMVVVMINGGDPGQAGLFFVCVGLNVFFIIIELIMTHYEGLLKNQKQQ